MADLTRRGFAVVSLAGFSTACLPPQICAAAQCAASGMPPLLPNQLAVDCASRQNFRLFRQHSEYVGLAGVVSVIDAKGPTETYRAGSLYLYPWLKPKGQALRNASLRAAFPTSPSSTKDANPIPNANLHQPEYLCNFVLKAPSQSFIGFLVDMPIESIAGRTAWVSNIPKLADNKGIGIDWTNANLNSRWFGGRYSIPDRDECNGNAWRKLIADGLNRASVSVC